MALRRVPLKGRLKASVLPVSQWDGASPSSRASACPLPYLQRHSSSIVKRGSGGRSSFSGVVATVLGATGFVGRYVVNRLGKIGSQVVVPYRGDVHAYRHLRLMGDLGQVVFLEYDIRDPESVRKVVQHSNVVINLVGRDYETRNFSFGDVHVEGAQVVAEACAQCGVEQLIHFSALGADPESPSTFLQSKAFGEEVVKEAFPEAVIVRPSDIYGYEDRFLRYYAGLRVIPFGIIPVLKRGVDVMKKPVHVGDIASGVIQLINEKASGATYEFYGPREYELADLVPYFYGVMYRPCWMVSPPHFVFNTMAYLLEQSPFAPYLTRDVLKRLHMSDSLTKNAPSLEDLGVSPVYLEDKVIAVLRMYRNFMNMSKPIEDTHPAYPRAAPPSNSNPTYYD